MHDDEDIQHDAQFSAHNKPSNNNVRIRWSWVVVVLLFLLIGMTGAYIIASGG